MVVDVSNHPLPFLNELVLKTSHTRHGSITICLNSDGGESAEVEIDEVDEQLKTIEKLNERSSLIIENGRRVSITSRISENRLVGEVGKKIEEVLDKSDERRRLLQELITEQEMLSDSITKLEQQIAPPNSKKKAPCLDLSLPFTGPRDAHTTKRTIVELSPYKPFKDATPVTPLADVSNNLLSVGNQVGAHSSSPPIPRHDEMYGWLAPLEKKHGARSRSRGRQKNKSREGTAAGAKKSLKQGKPVGADRSVPASTDPVRPKHPHHKSSAATQAPPKVEPLPEKRFGVMYGWLMPPEKAEKRGAKHSPVIASKSDQAHKTSKPADHHAKESAHPGDDKLTSMYGWAMRPKEQVHHKSTPTATRRSSSQSPRQIIGKERAPVPRICWREESPHEVDHFCVPGRRKESPPRYANFNVKKGCKYDVERFPCPKIQPTRTCRDDPPSCMPKRQ